MLRNIESPLVGLRSKTSLYKYAARPSHHKGLASLGRAGETPGETPALRCCCTDVHRPMASRLDKGRSQWHSGSVMDGKLDRLRELLRSFGSCLVAYSGGVDSAFPARVASDVRADKALAVLADSPSLPRRELAEALEVASRFQIPVRVVKTAQFENADYLANPANRCYFCKHELFDALTPISRAEGLAVIAYGENASDTGDFRPGAQAAAEFQVRAPLKEVGLTKAEIRELSAQFGLPTADKPQMACLSSRIPHGEHVTPEKLGMVERAECVLRDLGFYDVRVRHHELPLSVESLNRHTVKSGKDDSTIERFNGSTSLARIEVGPAEMGKVFENQRFARIAEALKKIGYGHVTLDLRGYRRGSLNESSVTLRTTD